MLHLGAHVFQDHVGLGGEAHERGVALGRLQVERDRAFVAVEVLEIEAVATAGDVLAFTGGWFDADDVGAPVGEVAHRGGSGAGKGEVKDCQAVERQSCFGARGLVHRAFRHRRPSCGRGIVGRVGLRLKGWGGGTEAGHRCR